MIRNHSAFPGTGSRVASARISLAGGALLFYLTRTLSVRA
jgi:hypothetical protein